MAHAEPATADEWIAEKARAAESHPHARPINDVELQYGCYVS